MPATKPKAPPHMGGINAADYLQAALDHSAALADLYDRGRYGLTVYVSGLAVECLFRAFRAQKGLPFRSDHPLDALAREAGFPELVPADSRTHFDAALGDVIVRWRNNHRFRSHTALRRFLKELKLDRKIKGDYLKENARLVSSSAFHVVNVGVLKWPSSRI